MKGGLQLARPSEVHETVRRALMELGGSVATVRVLREYIERKYGIYIPPQWLEAAFTIKQPKTPKMRPKTKLRRGMTVADLRGLCGNDGGYCTPQSSRHFGTRPTSHRGTRRTSRRGTGTPFSPEVQRALEESQRRRATNTQETRALM